MNDPIVRPSVPAHPRFTSPLPPAGSLAHVPELPVRRTTTMVPELDAVFGRSLDGDTGPALGAFTLLGGQEGMGKTRLYTYAYAMMAAMGFHVGLAQMEMSAAQYKGLLMNLARANRWSDDAVEQALGRIFVTNSRDYHEHLAMVQQHDLSVFVWDSYNMLHGKKTEAWVEQMVFDVKAGIEGRCHAMMICHLNAGGQIKGNGCIRYMVDATMYGTKEPHISPSHISVRMRKNRFGQSDVSAFFRHTDTGGLEVEDTGACLALEHLSKVKLRDFK